MEEVFVRFPHLSEQIFEKLSNKSLAETRKVSKIWCNNLDQQKFLEIRIIKATIEKFDNVHKTWENVFKSCNKETLTELRDQIISFDVCNILFGNDLTSFLLMAKF